MPNAKDFTGENDNILALGPPGVGKTSLFSTIPGKKFLYILDPNTLQTIKGQDIDYEIFLPEQLDLSAVTLRKDVRDPEGGAPPKTYLKFEEHFEEALRDDFFDDYDTIGIDGMTSLQDITMDRITFLNGRFGKHPEYADNTATMATVRKVVRTAASMGKRVFISAHTDMRTDDATGRLFNQMVLIGKLRNQIPMVFSEIWLCSGEEDKNGNIRYYVRTKPDKYNPYLRSAMQGIDTVEDVTIEDWSDPTKYGVGKLVEKSTGV